MAAGPVADDPNSDAKAKLRYAIALDVGTTIWKGHIPTSVSKIITLSH